MTSSVLTIACVLEVAPITFVLAFDWRASRAQRVELPVATPRKRLR